MYSARPYHLTVEEYNYLLPVLRKKLLTSDNKHFFIDNTDGLEDMLNRLKGLYNYYDELSSMTVYKCFIEITLDPFRKEVKGWLA